MKQFFNLKLMTAVAVFFSVLFITCKKTDDTSSSNSNYSSATTTGGTTTGTTGSGTTTGYASTTGGTTTSGSTTGGTTPAQVSIQGSKFNPSSITVAVGTTVTWVNKDSYTHTVTSNTELFNSGDVFGGGNYSYTFKSAGTFPYFCRYHRSMGMTGEVIVK